MRKLSLILASSLAVVGATGCARPDAIQADRTVFSVDSTFQRMAYAQPIEKTFDRTVTVFREAGYTLDVVDRATGQISGRRGKTGDKGAKTAEDLRFFALVLPGTGSGSQLALKFAQVSRVGLPVINQTQAEVVLSQPEVYAYVFRRVGDNSGIAAPAVDMASPANAPTLNADLVSLEPASEPR